MKKAVLYHMVSPFIIICFQDHLFLSDSDDQSTFDSDDSSSSEPDYDNTRYDVTVRVLSKVNEAGEQLSLCHLVAGTLNDEPSSTMYNITTEQQNRRTLFKWIETRCDTDLGNSSISKEKKDKLLLEGPRFVVAESMPDPSENKISFQTLIPEVTRDGDNEIYTYRHPSDSGLEIRIHEPMSPPKAVYVGNNQRSVSTMEHHKTVSEVI